MHYAAYNSLKTLMEFLLKKEVNCYHLNHVHIPPCREVSHLWMSLLLKSGSGWSVETLRWRTFERTGPPKIMRRIWCNRRSSRGMEQVNHLSILGDYNWNRIWFIVIVQSIFPPTDVLSTKTITFLISVDTRNACSLSASCASPSTAGNMATRTPPSISSQSSRSTGRCRIKFKTKWVDLKDSTSKL